MKRGVANLLDASHSWAVTEKGGQKAAAAHGREPGWSFSFVALTVCLSCLFSLRLFGIKTASSYMGSQPLAVKPSAAGWLVAVLPVTASRPMLRGAAVAFGSLPAPARCAWGSQKQTLFFVRSSRCKVSEMNRAGFVQLTRAMFLEDRGEGM